MKDYRIDNLIAAATSGVTILIMAWVFLSVLRRRMAERHELRRALLDKLSTDEVLRMVESDGGRKLLREVLAGSEGGRDAVERAMTMIFGSLGCGLAGWILHAPPLGALGMIGLAVGLGQLLTAAWMARRVD